MQLLAGSNVSCSAILYMYKQGSHCAHTGPSHVHCALRIYPTHRGRCAYIQHTTVIFAYHICIAESAQGVAVVAAHLAQRASTPGTVTAEAVSTPNSARQAQ